MNDSSSHLGCPSDSKPRVHHSSVRAQVHASSSRPTKWLGFFCSGSGDFQGLRFAPSTSDSAGPSTSPFAGDDGSDDIDTD